jgi:hypothetical protein
VKLLKNALHILKTQINISALYLKAVLSKTKINTYNKTYIKTQPLKLKIPLKQSYNPQFNEVIPGLIDKMKWNKATHSSDIKNKN